VIALGSLQTADPVKWECEHNLQRGGESLPNAGFNGLDQPSQQT